MDNTKRKDWIHCHCLNCDTEFYTPEYRVNAGRGKYCSRRCACVAAGKAFHVKYDQTGDANPNFIDGNWQARKAEYKARYRQKHPDAARAHDMIRRYLRAGKIKKQPCQVCGDAINVHAHHEDYSRPLDVEWLCAMHHRIRHGGTK